MRIAIVRLLWLVSSLLPLAASFATVRRKKRNTGVHWVPICAAVFHGLVGSVFAAPAAAAELSLEQNFAQPPTSARPIAWWHWMNGNITKVGITADLESMQRVGLAGAQIMNVANKSAVNIPAGPVNYLSPEWLDLVHFAATEAERLGLTLGMANSAGWSGSGGPWINPENSMKELVWSEVEIAGPTAEIKLPQPASQMDFYREVVVLAFPTPKVKTIPAKTTGKGEKKDEPDFAKADPDAIIAAADIVDLTAKMDASGKLNWQPPAGAWTVLRFGFTTNGKMNRPAPESATGLECDKLSRAALDAYWAGGIQPVLDKLGPLAGKVMTTILLDSYEADKQGWTDAMREEFQRRRGYDLTTFLPVFAGRAVGSRAETERFLWDFKRTLADLFADNYYGYLAEKCHRAGLKFSCEPYGGGGFEFGAVAQGTDVPMGEFWVNRGIHNSPKVAASLAHTQGQSIVGAEAFTAQPENGRWLQYPGSLKALGDLFWCHGINRFHLHAYAHQPWLDKFPGMTMGMWGTQFGRTITWWEQSGAWMNYLARSQALLQSGHFCADVLYFAGETPGSWPPVDAALRAAGYDYDLVGTDLIGQLRVENGDVVLPSGMRYRLLILKENSRMTLALAAKVRDLVQAGATVIATRPSGTPGLTNWKDNDAAVAVIAEQVWGAADRAEVGENKFGKGRVVWGRTPLEVLKTMTVAPDFQPKDAGTNLHYIHRRAGDSDIYFVSYQGDETKMVECFFRVTGRQPELWNPLTGEIQPAGLWEAAPQGTRVMLPFGPKGSLFVVFRQPTTKTATHFTSVSNDTTPAVWLPTLTESPQGARMLAWENGIYTLQKSSGGEKRATVNSLPKPLVVEQPWTVNFTPGWGAPERIELPQLLDWTKHSDAGVRYYSGMATYRTVLKLPADAISKENRVELDLGKVYVLAEVIVNGKNLGVLWCDPFRVDISQAVKAGDNALEIRVTNLWPNRMIGDEQFPADVEWAGKALKDWPAWLKAGQPRPVTNRFTFATWKHWNKSNALVPSGLIGPVQVRVGQFTEINP